MPQIKKVHFYIPTPILVFNILSSNFFLVTSVQYMIVCLAEEEQVPAIPGLPAVPPRKVSLTPKKITPPPPPPKNPLLKGKKLNKEECCLWDLTDKFRVTAHSVTNVAYQNHSKVLSSFLLLDCRARDDKEISSMDWCSTHNFVLNKQKTREW